MWGARPGQAVAVPTFSFPAAFDDPGAHPEAVRLMFELGRVVFAAHLLERKAANLWMDLSPEPAVLTAKTGFPLWNELISKLTATVETELAGETIIGGLRQALDNARRAQERRNRLIHDLTGLDVDQDPPVVVRLEWDPTVRRRCEITETIEAIRAAVDDLTWAAKNLGHQTGKLRGAGLPTTSTDVGR